MHTPAARSRRHFFSSKPIHLLWIILILIMLLVVAGQLLYPRTRALPLAKYGDISVGGWKTEDIEWDLNQIFNKSKLVVKSGDEKVTASMDLVGASFDGRREVEPLASYPTHERLIPLSILFKRPSVNKLRVQYEEKSLLDFSESLARDLSYEPEDAYLTIKNGKVGIVSQAPGYEIDAGSVKQAIKGAPLELDGLTELKITGQAIEPSRSVKDIDSVRRQAEWTIAKQLTITVNENDDWTFTPSSEVLASWLVVEETDAAAGIRLVVDESKIGEYLDEINQVVYKAPGITNVEVRDGREVKRTEGASGRELARAGLVDEIKQAILSDYQVYFTPANTRTLSPTVVYNNRFTSSQAGLQAYVDSIAKSRNVRIAIRQLTGERWSASARAGESTVSASTYKLYIALMVFDRIDSGKLRWSDRMLDTDVAGCFERMIVPSTNPCAENFIQMFGGGQAVNNFLYQLGFSRSTTFMSPVAVHTSASDLLFLLEGVQNGQLVKGANRDRLLSAMGRQLYRYGIPTGSKGRVSDKVGFLWDYIHDAGIVYHPRGTYIMSIMTRGGSYAQIAEITREVERIMYP